MHSLAPLLRGLFAAPVSVRVLAFDESRPAAGPLPPEVARSVPKRQAEFVAGRACAREALADAGCASGREVPIGPLRAPLWPAGFVGSITHAAGVAAAVVAPASLAESLGIDLEVIVSAEQAASLRASVARDDELARISAAAEGARVAFTTAFAAKEALFKCVAPLVGRYFDFLDAEIVSRTDDVLALRLRVDLGRGFGAGRVLPVRVALAEGRVIAGVALPPRPG